MWSLKIAFNKLNILAEEIELPNKGLAEPWGVGQLDWVINIKSNSFAVTIEMQQQAPFRGEHAAAVAGGREAERVDSKKQEDRVADPEFDQ